MCHYPFDCFLPTTLLTMIASSLTRMAYIEEGIKKKRGEQGIQDDEEPQDDAPYDPHEELFKIDERYRIQKKVANEEGSVTNSVAMLTAIPEVDLGME